MAGSKAKPLVFVGSSAESRQIANDIQQHLDPLEARVKVWPQNVFKISDFGLDSLLEVLKVSDFAIFVLTPDDVVTMRHKKHRAPRDNVIFELGLFMGRLGRRRTFLVRPSGVDLHLPTDLLGLTTVEFDPERADSFAALGPACNQIRAAIRERGPFPAEPSESETVLSSATIIEAPPPFRRLKTVPLRRKLPES